MGLQICLLQGLTCPTSKTEKNTQNLKGPTLSQAHRGVAFKNEHNLLVNNSQCVFISSENVQRNINTWP